MSKPALLLLAFCLVLPACGEEAPSFTVLKVVRGDDVEFKVVPAKEASAEKDRIVKEVKAAVAEWEKKRDAFTADKANRKRRFRDPKPDTAAVSKAKEGLPSQEEAQKLADEEKTKAEGKYAVLRIIDTDKSSSLQVVPQKKIKAKEAEMQDRFDEEMEAYNAKRDAWFSDPVAHPPGSMPFSEKPPDKPKVVRLKDGFPDREAAEKAKAEFEKAEPKK